MAVSPLAPNNPGADAVTTHVICAVDGSPQAEVAVRQAATLAAPRRLDLVTVADRSIAVHGGWAMSDLLEMVELDARQALAAAASAADVNASTILRGDPAGCVLKHLRKERATLVAAGTHGHTRAAGILLGSVGTRLLHEAPCSVLIARPSDAQEPWPARILVGIDGSHQATVAGDVALGLADRFGAECVAVTATGDKGVDLAAARASFAGPLEEFPAGAAAALIESAHEADLLVVGSRGLHGLKALGSVSERVAHRAKCSVLVVRPNEADAA